jgi:hypothetical protein
MADLIGLVRMLREEVQDGRTLQDIFKHGQGEMEELGDEIELRAKGLTPGPDGIVGEGIDVILCKLDLILEAEPNITNEQILEIARTKGRKWIVGAAAKKVAKFDAATA